MMMHPENVALPRISPAPLIAIGGPMRAGKDTVIEMILHKRFPVYGVVDTSDTLIHEYSARTGIPVKIIREQKEHHRPGLLALGDEYERGEVAGVARAAFLRHAQAGLDFGGLIFSSIRRSAECWLMQELGATIIYIQADEKVRAGRPGYKKTDHPTETETLDWLQKNATYIVPNNYTLEALETEVERMIKTLNL